MHHAKHKNTQHSSGHTSTHNSHATESRPRALKALLGVLLVAQLMVILDITAVNIALPTPRRATCT